MPEESKTVHTLTEQTLPDFLFSVILEQRKSIATLIDALNEAKAGIDQLAASAERSEESRRQAETALERQTVVESDLKFDLTQARQHNEGLQRQIKTLEESLARAEKLLSGEGEKRSKLQEVCDQRTASVQRQSSAIATLMEKVATLKSDLAAKALSESEVEDNTTAPERLATIRTYQPDNGTMLPDEKERHAN